ncbi:MAG: regulator of chromosome condensation 1/beta-lactamase-inhibitor protein II, partial [Olpidium bornovanus]
AVASGNIRRPLIFSFFGQLSPVTTTKDKGKGRAAPSPPPPPPAKRPTAPPGAPRMPKNAVELLPLARRRTVEGEVFTFGTGEMGQLGLGEDCIQRKKPMPLGHLNADEKVVDLAVGGMHTLALTNKGEVYSWGVNDNGALGRDGDENYPEKVEGLEGVDVVSIAAGDSISCAISNTGRLYMWGSFRGQVFCRLRPHARMVTNGGGERAACWTTSDANATFGPEQKGGNGLLGFTKDNRGMQKVPQLMEYFLNVNIVQVAAGDDHVLALTSLGEVY